MSEPDRKTSGQALTWTSEQPEVVEIDLTGKTLGEFQVERMLGRGGMGDVYLANQTGLNRHVAIKVLRADFLSKPAYLSRFEIEATAIAKLNHPNIVHVYTLGCVDNIRFIAMEYVQGTNLKEYVVRKGALDLPLSLSIMRQTGQAIAAAAEVGLIHRDIKPENILLTKKGRVKVADFGLCRDQEAEPVHLTQPGVTMGTPSYMSPEQAQGHELDHRSDLYSMGVTFYFMLVGVPPFRGESALALAIKHVKEKAPNLRSHRPDMPAEIDLLVMKLMAKNPKDRFQSATEMLAELSRIKDKFQIGTAQHAVYGDSQAAALLSLSPGSGGGVALLGAPSTAEPRNMSLAKFGQALPSMISSLISLKMMIPTALAAILIGAGMGWMARSPDLINSDVAELRQPPGLWLSPDWRKSVPAQPTAEQQYRRAQLQSLPDQQAASWLAVSARFPNERDWATKSYIQLGRLLFRERDRSSLVALAGDLKRWRDPRGKEPLTVDLELAQLLEIGAKLLEGDDLEGVVGGLDRMKLDSVYETSIHDLAYEIVSEARLFADRSNAHAAVNKLATIQLTLMPKLMFIEALKPGNGLRKKPAS